MIMQICQIDVDDSDEIVKLMKRLIVSMYDAAALVLIDEWRETAMILEAKVVGVNAAVLDR